MKKTIFICLICLILSCQSSNEIKHPMHKSKEVTAVPASLIKHLNLDPFYKKYYSAKGLSIMSSEKVSGYALKEAAYLINIMLGDRDDIRKEMIKNNVRYVIYGTTEFTADVPEHKKGFIDDDYRSSEWWNRRARGLGASIDIPVTTSGEENLLCYEGDPYSEENILIHEFAHTMHACGIAPLDKTFNIRLEKFYDSAMEKDLWEGAYASTNFEEYWAEGVQCYFNNNRENDNAHNHVDTRKELKEYDINLFNLCKEIFGTRKWTYTKPSTRLHQKHLKGYDPKKAPVFAWPKHLKNIAIK